MGPPSEEEVKSALTGLLKIASVACISVGVVIVCCGVLAVSVVGGLTTPIIIGSAQTAVGVLFVGSGWLRLQQVQEPSSCAEGGDGDEGPGTRLGVRLRDRYHRHARFRRPRVGSGPNRWQCCGSGCWKYL
ncbi:uncharacterized protein LOC125045640 [Penaeus chinensis]|uniref:uncharacterized protein LOC125045640 n=1 Tax=Penaeus chinensis TaxID=139456 RepID=UPI001FB67EBC|nr:uncharacterized protein LOC125045640 [Penaeus chinensis]